jgi:hypothetical protein
MTSEEWQSRVEFLLSQQAAFDARLQAQAEHWAQEHARFYDRMKELDARQDRFERQLRAIARFGARYMRQARQRETDFDNRLRALDTRLDRLAALIERAITRNGFGGDDGQG